MSDPRITRILGKLAIVRERRIETFGADTHRYQLAAPLAEAELRAVEARHGIELPAAYRAFVTLAGASGAGPYYGIVPHERWGALLYGDVAMPDWAARPCAWTSDTPRDDATWKQVSGGLDEPFQGAIVIADQGCAYYATLVVTGVERGRVMYVSLDGGVPFFPESPDFLAWYERWVDELLWGHVHFWFGTTMPGDEAALAVAAGTGSPRRLDALCAMYRLPALAPATAELVALRVRDDDPAVRAAALGLVGKFAQVAALEPHVRHALTDAAPDVRRAALRALAGAGEGWHDDARRALADPVDEIVVAAVRALDGARALALDDLAPLLARAGAVRDAALHAAGAAPSEALLDRVLPLAAAEGDDRHPVAVIAMLAHIRKGVGTPSQRDAALEVLLVRLARPTEAGGRSAEIYGLGPFVATHPRALATLFELTRDPEPFTRYEAATVLGQVGGPDAIEPLRALLADTAKPRARSRSTGWNVGEGARRALARLEARLAGG